MRVEPELPTHLKFRRLKAAVGDVAMECLIVIWGHCQQNQRGEFWPGADADYVEMLCHWSGQKGELYKALLTCGLNKAGFIQEDTVDEVAGIRIHDWEESNSQTVKNWSRNPNGRKATVKPTRTHGLPQGYPQRKPTGYPMGNPSPTSTGPKTQGGQNASEPISTGAATGSRDNHPTPPQEPTGYPKATPNGNPRATPTSIIPSINPSNPNQLAADRIQLLNQLTGAQFSLPIMELEHVQRRIEEVDYDTAGVDLMLRHQVELWGSDPKSRAWLKPSTLFGPNFHDYYGQRNVSNTGTSAPAGKTNRRELLETLTAARLAQQQKPDDADIRREVERLERELASPNV